METIHELSEKVMEILSDKSKGVIMQDNYHNALGICFYGYSIISPLPGPYTVAVWKVTAKNVPASLFIHP